MGGKGIFPFSKYRSGARGVQGSASAGFVHMESFPRQGLGRRLGMDVKHQTSLFLKKVFIYLIFLTEEKEGRMRERNIDV